MNGIDVMYETTSVEWEEERNVVVNAKPHQRLISIEDPSP